MTRKDYVLIAAALKRAAALPGQLSNEWRGTHAAAQCIADALAVDNPRFDRERFLRAAGVQS